MSDFPFKVRIPCDDEDIDRLRNHAKIFVGKEYVDWECEWHNSGCVEFGFSDPNNQEFFEKIKRNNRDS